jgi:hypothetical protein
VGPFEPGIMAMRSRSFVRDVAICASLLLFAELSWPEVVALRAIYGVECLVDGVMDVV